MGRMNPFTNCTIVGDQVDPAVYLVSVGESDSGPARRGDHAFVMSRSSLMEVWLCAERWRDGFERKESNATDYGSRFDALALDNKRWLEKYTVAPATYPCEPTKKDPRTEKPWNGNSDWCRTWKTEAEKNGLEVLSVKEDADVKDAVIVLHKQPIISELIKSSRKQVFVTGEYKDRETGLVIPVKTLIDLVSEDRLGDLKSSSSADPLRWAKTCFDYNYDAQAAMNLDLFNAATDEERTDFFHVIQENYAPWQVCFPIPILSVELVEIGRMKVMAALRHYAQCLKSGNWPGYSPTRTAWHPWQIIDATPYMQARVGERYVFQNDEPTEFKSEMPT